MRWDLPRSGGVILEFRHSLHTSHPACKGTDRKTSPFVFSFKYANSEEILYAGRVGILEKNVAQNE